MIVVELFAPAGVLDPTQHQRLGRRLIDALMGTEDAHAQPVMDSARALTHVLIHEPAAWITGDRHPVDPSDPPRYLVRVSAPTAWRKELSAHAIDRLTQALAETEAEAGRAPDRLRDQPHALVQVVGIAEGSLGMCGRPMGSLDLIQHMTAPHRDAIADMTTAGLPPGTVIDPVCGMTVDLNSTDLTLEFEDTLYGFCNGQCRRIFADERGIPLTA
ncbi:MULTISPECIES: YHS domain-containing protein [Streptomyces]|jgi:YHS domain-containing protein|uniref:YHS domain-containing protein n=1 Tax=Streptomyces spinosisporus TaxID=2927582 RepID=A0ABS9XBY9_9ACTN|nr:MULTISPECIES: YHS domain-containing protein [Streptomyces]MCI3238866.1 YHS domain-containing protein [Streptomyces spinosisporus]WUB34758.1 YHS domain-containing protein [Streptomyces sp. NBC_00588]